MANVLVSESTLTAIGDAIRQKSGGTATYLPSEMPDAIRAIPSDVITVDCGTITQLPFSKSSSAITSDMVVVKEYLSNPYAQASVWTVVTQDGNLNIQGSINGSTDLILYLTPSR